MTTAPAEPPDGPVAGGARAEPGDIVERLKRHAGAAIMGCTCRSDTPNCMACDCGNAADVITALRQRADEWRLAAIADRDRYHAVLERVAELEAALRPFAEAQRTYVLKQPFAGIINGHWLAAAAALPKGGEGGATRKWLRRIGARRGVGRKG